jgi:sugar O-acyltransferase (sialic acid O-acetyltransferase NeuD family)
MKEKIFLIGGGGHAHACIDVIESSGQYEIAGIFDLKENVGKTIFGYKVLGTDNELENYLSITRNVLITIGQIKNYTPRVNKYFELLKLGAQFPVIISARAHVSRHAVIESGSIIMHDALVVAGANIGRNCIINNKALIEHDVVVGDFCHVSTAAVVNGGCRIGSKTFIGSNTVLKEGIIVPDETVVAAGTFFKGVRH